MAVAQHLQLRSLVERRAAALDRLAHGIQQYIVAKRLGEKLDRALLIKLVALVFLCFMIGTAVAEEPKITSLMSKDLPEDPGREALMIIVEHAPGGSSAIHRHNAHAFVYVLEGSVVMQLKGGQQVTLTP